MKPQYGIIPSSPKVVEIIGYPRKVALLKMKANWASVASDLFQILLLKMSFEMRIRLTMTMTPASAPMKNRFNRLSFDVDGKAEKSEAGIKTERRRLMKLLFDSGVMSFLLPRMNPRRIMMAITPREM